jgi:hypothetical protein
MPVSDYHAVSDIMGEIQRISPRSVLDLGVGFGKWGVLCREILDARFGRCGEMQWEARIDGYEVHRPYENPLWEAYDLVFFQDFRGIESRNYDLVLMVDSLEHMPLDEGRPFLKGLVQRNKHVIVSVPNGRMEQGETFGNPHEAHLWTFNGTEEFEPYNFKLIHQSVCTVVSIKGVKWRFQK